VEGESENESLCSASGYALVSNSKDPKGAGSNPIETAKIQKFGMRLLAYARAECTPVLRMRR